MASLLSLLRKMNVFFNLVISHPLLFIRFVNHAPLNGTRSIKTAQSSGRFRDKGTHKGASLSPSQEPKIGGPLCSGTENQLRPPGARQRQRGQLQRHTHGELRDAKFDHLANAGPERDAEAPLEGCRA